MEVEKWFGDISAHSQFSQLITNVSFFIPLTTVFVTQYLLPEFPDDVFFSTFSVLDSVKSETYRSVASMGFWSVLALRFRRFLRLSFWSLVTYCLSLVPFVGWMVIPIAQFYLVSKIFGFKTASIFSSLLLFPSLRAYSWPTVKVLFGARALAIEMLDPYFSRFGYEKIKLTLDRKTTPTSFAWLCGPLFVLHDSALAGAFAVGLSAGLNSSACIGYFPSFQNPKLAFPDPDPPSSPNLLF